jgi:dTMP kinase
MERNDGPEADPRPGPNDRGQADRSVRTGVPPAAPAPEPAAGDRPIHDVPVRDVPAPDLPVQDHDIAAVLRVTSFRRLWLALSGSSLGDWLGLLATTELARQLGGESYAQANLAVAGVLILRLAPAVLLGPLAGALADRLDRKLVMVVGDVLRGLLFITIPIVGTLEWLFVATVLIECVALFWAPAKEATVPNLVPRNRLEAANQMSLVTTYGTAPVAALLFAGTGLLSGILDNFFRRLETNPVDLALYVNALTFIISGVVIARLPIPKQTIGDGAEPVSVWRSITDGWRFIGTTPLIRGLVVGMLGAFAGAGFVIGLASTFVNDLGAGQPGYGVLFAAVFLGLAVGMWGGPRFFAEFSRYRLFGLSLVCAGGFLAAIALIPNMVMAVLFTIGLGACGGIAWVTGYTLLGLSVDDAVRGRTFAFIASAARIVLITVLAAGPALAALIGRHTIHFTDTRQLTYNGAAFVFLLAAVLVVTLGASAYRQMDDRPGARLTHDLRRIWSDRRETPARPARRTYPGVFIAFEGGDGSGKSTQGHLLAEWLREDQGHDVVLTREPGGTPIGTRLRELLLGPGTAVGARAEALLFAADRADHVSSLVRPALEAGSIVVTDRYTDSSVAYQGAGRELDGDEVARVSRWATDGLLPDLTVLLDVDPEIGRGRRAGDAGRDGDDRLESLSDDFHARVRERFLDLARREPHRYLVVDAGQGVEEIHAAVRARVRDLLPISERRRAELKERLTEEEQGRRRRAAAEAEVLRMDADLRTRRLGEAREREDARRRARDEAERQLQQETERELRAQGSSRSRIEADLRAAEAAALAAAALEPMTGEPVTAEPMTGDGTGAHGTGSGHMTPTGEETVGGRPRSDAGAEPVTERLPVLDGPASGAAGGVEAVRAIGRAAEAVTRAARTPPPSRSGPLVPGFPDRRPPAPPVDPGPQRAEPEQYQSSSDQYRPSSDQYQSSSDQYQSSSDQYRPSSDQYPSSFDDHPAEPDRYRAEPDDHRPEPQRQASDRYPLGQYAEELDAAPGPDEYSPDPHSRTAYPADPYAPPPSGPVGDEDERHRPGRHR